MAEYWMSNWVKNARFVLDLLYRGLLRHFCTANFDSSIDDISTRMIPSLELRCKIIAISITLVLTTGFNYYL